jgi:hypothetical protein
MAIDPGDHEITALVNGNELFRHKVTIAGDATRTVVTVSLPSRPSPRPVQSRPPDLVTSAITPGASNRRHLFYGVGAASAVALATGMAAGVYAVLTDRAADRGCREGCTDEAARLSRQATAAAWTSNVSLGLGVIGAAGAFLIHRSDSDATRRVSAASKWHLMAATDRLSFAYARRW